ncbi:hypothetical protein DL239_18165 [Sedimentitalea sp. CY04]|uniref:Uncharacterized protein n=1 Tax=Parasedimentitalea denitrificans TaxID=2211118 RepID=A0ABX0WF00_9RHOB|nr:hypothetical protein [Sedimentitalea sp. CY04]NIZ62895.1 hypothetical protein [Sedimentitalea sp. CY04]
MHGVVLWSDESQNKAVIWCEDQGDLAFYSQKKPLETVDLHEGDLICFDLTLHQNCRMAENLQVLEHSASVGLVKSLTTAQVESASKPISDQNSAQVISFSARLEQKQRENEPRRHCAS